MHTFKPERLALLVLSIGMLCGCVQLRAAEEASWNSYWYGGDTYAPPQTDI